MIMGRTVFVHVILKLVQAYRLLALLAITELKTCFKMPCTNVLPKATWLEHTACQETSVSLPACSLAFCEAGPAAAPYK